MAGIAHFHADDGAVACDVIEVDVGKCDKDGLSTALEAALDRVVAARSAGWSVILVVYGVFPVWNEVACAPPRKSANPALRSVAILGQMHVASCCERVLSAKGLVGAQLLLGSDIISSVAGRNRVGHLLSRLLGLGTIPVIFKNYITEWTEADAENRFRNQIGDLMSTQMISKHQKSRCSGRASKQE